MPSLRMPNDVGQAFLNAAVNREVDRVAIAAYEVVRANSEFDLRMLPRAIAHQLAENIPQRNVAERHRTQAVEHAAIDALQLLDDREHVVHALDHFARGLVLELRGRSRDRCRMRLEPEQVRTDLVVQVERSAP